jgi:uncharacterized protein (UPF0305 family)
MFDCVRLIAEGKQSINNFGLHYLSVTQLELLKKCRFVEFTVENQYIREISKQVINNLKNYYRIQRTDKN